MGVVNAPPANLVASDGTNPHWIHLGWDHVDYAQGYLIEYKPSAGFTQRAEAHWEGYVANAARATCQCWKCKEKQQ